MTFYNFLVTYTINNNTFFIVFITKERAEAYIQKHLPKRTETAQIHNIHWNNYFKSCNKFYFDKRELQPILYPYYSADIKNPDFAVAYAIEE